MAKTGCIDARKMKKPAKSLGCLFYTKEGIFYLLKTEYQKILPFPVTAK
jgi:hypothetical protein